MIVSGARQVGKSTLAELVAGRDAVRNLDEPAMRAAAYEDPAEFVRHDHGLMVIDEIQRVPELLLAVKAGVDQDRRPGRFLLTGSADIAALAGVRGALVGRSETITLWPFSQGEIDGTADGLVGFLLGGGDPRDAVGGVTPRSGYVDRALRGGFPEAVARSPHRRSAFATSYVADLVERDVPDLREIRLRGGLRTTVELLAASTTGPLVVQRIASDLGVNHATAQAHIAVLEAVYLVTLIPAWSSNLTRRTTAHPKLVFNDSGLLGALLGHSVERFDDPTAPIGPLIENFVLGEVARQLTWSPTPAHLHHYRTRDGVEVDAILERPDGRLVAIEVKASTAIRPDHLKGLRHLRHRLGDRIAASVILHAGPHILSFGDGVWALPIDSLWMTGGPDRVGS